MARAAIYDVLERWQATAESAEWTLLPLCCLIAKRAGDSSDRRQHNKGSLHADALSIGASPQATQPENALPEAMHTSLGYCSREGHSPSLSNRIAVFPRSLFSQHHNTALACSRYPAADRLDLQLADAVRTWLVSASHCNPRPTLISAEGMTLDAILTVLAPRFQLPLIRLIPSKTKNAHRWLEQISASIAAHPQYQPIFISPEIQAETGEKIGLDHLVFKMAEHLHAFYVRPNSKTSKLVQNRLEEPTYDRKTASHRTHIWIPPEPESRESKLMVAHRQQSLQWMNQGAVGWYLPANHSHNRRSPITSSERVLRFPESFDEEFLFHHTRACHVAWPEETEEERWIRWLNQNQQVGALQTLLRIVTQGRLRANGRLIPTGKPMVCFSQRPPRAAVAARSFRSHLSRWDYEPYGMAIGKKCLIDLGANPVTYFEDSSELPSTVAIEFTQKRYSSTKSGQTWDWSKEQEFRLPGDLDLFALPLSDLLLFTPTRSEATELASVSRWQVGFLYDN